MGKLAPLLPLVSPDPFWRRRRCPPPPANGTSVLNRPSFASIALPFVSADPFWRRRGCRRGCSPRGRTAQTSPAGRTSWVPAREVRGKMCLCVFVRWVPRTEEETSTSGISRSQRILRYTAVQRYHSDTFVVFGPMLVSELRTPSCSALLT